jgi:hypothetical protein
MIHDPAIAHVIRPLAEPLPPALQQRSQQVLEALEGLDAKDQLNLACRTVVAVLMAARPRFATSAQDHAAYNTLCDAVGQWLRREMGPLRFGRPK